MHTIDIILQNTPLPISVQRKETEGAEALYNQLLEAMKSAEPQLIELSCEKQEDKKVAVKSDRINAVVVSQKSGATTSGRAPGFFAATSIE